VAEVADSKEETTLWFKRVRAGEMIREEWEKACRVKDSYQYWRGRQRLEERSTIRFTQILPVLSLPCTSTTLQDVSSLLLSV